MLLKIFNILFLCAFLLSAAVQYNDPDALLWILIYLAAAGMCLLQLLQRQPRWLPPLLLLICAAWAAILLPNIVGQVSWEEISASLGMRTQAVEEAREIGGLLIVAFWSSVLLLKRQRNA